MRTKRTINETIKAKLGGEQDRTAWARRILDSPREFPRIAVDFAREVLPSYKPQAEDELKPATKSDWAMAAAHDMVEF